MALIKSYQKSNDRYRVTFRLSVSDLYREVGEIRLIGDFCDWNAQQAPILSSAADHYEVSLDLEPNSSYEFRYLLDGREWMNDPAADQYVPSPYIGVFNSRVDLAMPKKSTAGSSPGSKKKSSEAFANPSRKESTASAKNMAASATDPRQLATAKVSKKKKESTASKSSKKKVSSSAKKSPKDKKTLPAGSISATRGRPAKKIKKAAPVTKKKTQRRVDLTIIEGVGPKIQQKLKKAGYKSLEDVAQARVGDLRKLLEEAGPHYRMHDPSTWKKQARLAAKGNLDALYTYQSTLKRGKKN